MSTKNKFLPIILSKFMKYGVKFIKHYTDIQPSQNENKLKPLLKTELLSD
jgi:hypothetical protein